MNNFHKIIDDAFSKNLLVVNEIEDHDAKIALKLFNDQSSQAVCFDIGEIETWEDFSYDDTQINLPYPVTWFEANYIREGKKEHVGALCWENVTDCKNEIIFLSLIKQHQQPWIIFGLTFNTISEGKIHRECLPADRNIGLKLETLSSIIFCFLTALNCNNINAVENLPNEKIQKKRRKSGKMPLFSTWTLHLDLISKNSNSSNSLGHASSPRVHLRRGHPRQYKPGKWTWVNSCVVGNKKAGIIHKDYDIAQKNT
ncbi:MAG: hypothetical protein GQ578_05140 [Desulfuromonadaceae bacterium]|nr:hypothetical protein [Desulfuromonadaceae bacterium]